MSSSFSQRNPKYSTKPKSTNQSYKSKHLTRLIPDKGQFRSIAIELLSSVTLKLIDASSHLEHVQVGMFAMVLNDLRQHGLELNRILSIR